ncbi:aldolase [Zobellella denitrificans]|jgi:ribulose-5-phosphate 4-epimerase/fuculose-1-phosphate aldolase|uniref:3-oxo-tetronate 4-phosphate decarboxylase n=1 Tax=Zobellella denitrificans TaxID=347534 RepID=A0A231N001_9GAMM|nr:aldolase [Zobellella denitrificans]ATG75488.1 aldolase [Zobellella denitrificans]OXS15629.1 aldolase [Zobellella denitrificans]
MTEFSLRLEMVKIAKSMFERGYSSGGAGNLSLVLPDGNLLATPTNTSFGDLDPDRLSKVDMNGNHLDGDKPSKEVLMHIAMYQQRPQAGGIVHLHSPYLTALSCVDGLDPANCLPPITPYYVMRVGKLPLIPYFRPGSPRIAEELGKLAAGHGAVLLANHGPVISGKSLREAMFNAEELEETARLYFILRNGPMRTLTDDQVAELEQVFKGKM